MQAGSRTRFYRMLCSAGGTRALAAASASAAAPKDNLQQALSVFILHLEQASPALSVVGQLDRLALDVEELL